MKTRLIQLLIIFIPSISYGQMNSSIEFIFGFENSYRTLKTTSDDPIVVGMMASRDGRELNKLNWRVGFNYNKQLTKKFFLKSGVRLVSVGYKNEKMTDLRWPSEIGPNGFMFDPSLPHELQLIYDYWFLEIPLAARFELSNNKFSPFLEMGISPSIYLTTRTTSITDIDTKVSYQKGGTADYKNIHWVGFASVGANYSVTEKLQLFGQAIYRTHFT